MSEESWKSTDDWYENTRYQITETPERLDQTEAPGVRVVVEHPSTHYGYESQPPGNPPNHHWEEVNERLRSKDISDNLYREQAGEGPDGQQALFNISHKHPYVGFMATHPAYRHHVASLLGVAALETRARYGEDLRSDNSLSESSSKMVHRLAEAGIVSPPSNEQRNNLTRRHFADYWIGTPLADIQEKRRVEFLPSNTMRVGRQFAREVLRRTRQSVDRARPVIEAVKGEQGKMFE